jgi:hypothetical protein
VPEKISQKGGISMARKKHIIKHTIPKDMDAWERMPGESPILYERFCYYRDMIYMPDEDNDGKGSILDKTKRRSYRETADHFGVNSNTIENQAKRWRWPERIEAYDTWVAYLARLDTEKKVKKMLNNHATLGAAMVQRAAKRFISLNEKDIDAANAIRMADVGVKIERMSRGISTEETVLNLNVPNGGLNGNGEPQEKPSADIDVPDLNLDLSSLSDEELSSLDGILGKLTEKPEE